MYLKSLTLKGFKSFAKPTTFEFEPGVTAVVGPNGSGKSNVVDALAWVMGEQGAKTLRGGKMDDVIFAGTSSRGPLGRAEVKLTIDNTDGALPIDYAEVTISRVLFRSGASEYAINGEQCRLLDVQELLSDSGLGQQMHVIVGQGQLDSVLRATADDRRGFIEEAAGILKHRKRKERTLRKLDAMETNLTRLSDLAGEIRRQLKPLGRQAEVARAARQIAAEVRDAKARLLADDVMRLRLEIDDLTRDDAQRHTEKVVLTEQHEQKLLRIQKLEHDQQNDEVDAARRVSLDLERVQGRLRGLYDQVQQRLTFLATQSDGPTVATELSSETVLAAEQEVQELAAKLPEVQELLQAAAVQTAKGKEALDALDEHIAAQSALVASHDLAISKLRGRVETATQNLATLEKEHSRRDTAVAEAQERLAAAERLLAEFVMQNGDAADPDTTAPDITAQKDYETASEEHTLAQTTLNEMRDKTHDLERQKAALDAKVAALSSALEAGQASEQFKELTLGTLAEHVRPKPGYEQAVSAALGTLSEAFVVDSARRAAEVLSLAEEQELGRVRVFVDAGGDVGVAVENAANSEFTAISEFFEATAAVQELLAGVYFVDDGGRDPQYSALSLFFAQHPQATLVTNSGRVITRFLWEGGTGDSPSKIELLAERDRSAEELGQLQLNLSKQAEQLAAQKTTVADAKERETRAFAAMREADSKRAKLDKERNRLNISAQAARSELQRLTASAAQAVTATTDAKKALADAERALEEALAAPKPIFNPEERGSVFEELEALRAAELRARIDFETARERHRAGKEQHETLVRQLEAQKQAAEEAARRRVLRERQVREAQRVAAALPPVIDSCDRSLAEARTQQQGLEAERAKHSQELVLLRAEESELRARLAKLTELNHSTELKAYERKLSLSSLLERAADELGLVEDVLIAEYGPGSGDDEFVRAEEEARLAKAQRRLNELGRINPLALEEFAALEKRHSFLTEQLQDLQNTKKDLLAIIREIDGKMEGIFAEAFEDTREAFAEIFPILFPGGSGDIFLTDPESMLTTGIEVTIRPAGKKIERLSLLSGGERSLAAVAWLMAIFHARPSPFYIMDEVEAALDDANLGRLLQVFERLREDSQLIVITHQKRTMEIADALYGVSMRGDGISEVIGQRVR